VGSISENLGSLPNLCRSAIFEVLRELMRAIRLALMRGGPARRFRPDDHALFARDLESLSDVFATGGEGADGKGERCAQPLAPRTGPARTGPGPTRDDRPGVPRAARTARLSRAQVELLVRPLLNVVLATAMDSEILIAKFEVRTASPLARPASCRPGRARLRRPPRAARRGRGLHL